MSNQDVFLPGQNDWPLHHIWILHSKWRMTLRIASRQALPSPTRMTDGNVLVEKTIEQLLHHLHPVKPSAELTVPGSMQVQTYVLI